jgi:hypothetical protein
MVRLRTEQLRLHAGHAGAATNAAIAALLGMDPANVGRLLSGEIQPGESTIACVLAAFPDLQFEDLFDIGELK